MAVEGEPLRVEADQVLLAVGQAPERGFLVEGDPVLFNPYGVIAVDPDKGPQIRQELTNAFIDWLISVPTQEKIDQFGVDEFGSPLFTPDSASWRAAHSK